LDLPNTDGYSITQNRTELTEFDQIADEAVLPLALPQTVKNNWFFRQYTSPGIVDNTFAEISVRASEGAVYLSQDVIQYLGQDDPNNSHSINLAKSDSFWLKGSKSLKLSDIDFGTFTFTKANIEAQWANPDYQTGDAFVNFWTTHWGENYTPTYYFEKHRPYLSVLGTLIQGFCALGWQFSSEVFESDWGRRLWWYHCDNDLFTYTNKGDANYNVQVTWDGATWTENLDNGAKFTPATSRYQNSGTAGETIPMTVSVTRTETFTNPTGSGNTFFYEILLVKLDSVGTILETITELYTVAEGSTININRTYEINLNENEQIEIQSRLQVGAGAPGATTPQTGTVVTFTSIGDYYHDGDTITINEVVNQEFTFHDFLRGVIGLGDFKINTNYSNQTVEILPRTGTTIESTSVSGFLNDNSTAIDLTNKIVSNSLRSTIAKQESARNIVYQFADSSDEYIDSLNLSDDAPLYSRTVDLGFGNEKETETVENPFFESTADNSLDNITIPYMWDNTEGNISKEIAPRIVYAVGAVAQVAQGQAATDGQQWNYDGNATATTFGYASQDPNSFYTDGVTVSSTTNSVMYGTESNDLYKTFIEKNLRTLRQSVTYEFLARLNINDWAALDFREKVKIYYRGFTFFAELIEKRDHLLGSNLPTPIVVVPDLQLSTQIDCVTRTYQATGANNYLFSIALGDGTGISNFGGFNFPYLNDGVTVGTFETDLNTFLTNNDPGGSATVVVDGATRAVTITVTSTIVFNAMVLTSAPTGGTFNVINFNTI